MTDYGTFTVYLHPFLSLDQKVTIVKQSVENQLVTKNRNHSIDIIHQCIEMSKIFSVPMNISIKMKEYEYKLELKQH